MMTQPEQQEIVQRSSVKISRNAKGDAQWEIKVLVGESESDVIEARQIAIREYEAIRRELG